MVDFGPILCGSGLGSPAFGSDYCFLYLLFFCFVFAHGLLVGSTVDSQQVWEPRGREPEFLTMPHCSDLYFMVLWGGQCGYLLSLACFPRACG